MTIGNKLLIEDITHELECVDDLRSRVKFLERVLKQLVLTHGRLSCDPSLASAAEDPKKTLWFGNGHVCINGE